MCNLIQYTWYFYTVVLGYDLAGGCPGTFPFSFYMDSILINRWTRK